MTSALGVGVFKIMPSHQQRVLLRRMCGVPFELERSALFSHHLTVRYQHQSEIVF